MKTLSLKMEDNIFQETEDVIFQETEDVIFQETEDVLSKVKKSRNSYINEEWIINDCLSQ